MDLEEMPSASASALSGNAVFISALLDIVNVTADLLGEGIITFLPIVLYSVVEKASPVHHHHVRQSALETLGRLAKADGYSNLSIFLAKHFDYLVDSLIGALRQEFVLQPGEDLFCSGIIDYLLRAVGKSWEQNSSYINVAHVSLLAELLDHVLVAYDDSAIRARNDMQGHAALSLLKIFDAAIFPLHAAIADTHRKCELDDENTDGEKWPIEVKEPWFTSLAEFKLDGDPSDDDDDDNSDALHVLSEDNFRRDHKIREEANRDDRGIKDSASMTNQDDSGGPIQETAWVASVIAASSSILSRCCYLLSVPDLKVERAACKSIISALRLLALAEEAQRKNAEEEGKVGNVLFMSISSVWPSIHQRLKMISQQFRAKDNDTTTIIVSASQPRSRDTAPFHDKVFIAELFELIGCICELSGDFMTSRFEQDVWPIFAELIGHEVMLRERRRIGDSGNKKMSATRKAIACANHCENTMSDDDRKQQMALLAMLRCTSQSLHPRVIGAGLIGLVPQVGTLILPLLSCEGQVGDASEEVVKALLILDCDALWRPLLDLCGGRVQPRPYKSRSKLSGTPRDDNNACSAAAIVTTDRKTANSSLMRRAMALSKFANTLDEQRW